MIAAFSLALGLVACGGPGKTTPTLDVDAGQWIDSGTDPADSGTDPADSGTDSDAGVVWWDDVACRDVAPGPEPAEGSVPNGGACTDYDQCAGDEGEGFGSCRQEEFVGQGYPGGFCTSMCVVPLDDGYADCPDLGECVVEAGWVSADLYLGVGHCYPTCADSADCRPGYGCYDFVDINFPICVADCDERCDSCAETGTCNPYSGYCEPLLGLGIDGDPCFMPEDCESFNCATDEDGFPGGYCFSFCSGGSNCPLDPIDGIASPCRRDLVSSTVGVGVCDDGCLVDSDCRTDEGYTCQDVEGGRACVPPL